MNSVEFEELCKKMSIKVEFGENRDKIQELLNKNKFASTLINEDSIVKEIREFFCKKTGRRLTNYKIYTILLYIENILKSRNVNIISDEDLKSISGGTENKTDIILEIGSIISKKR
ncbi:MAG: hypothetical protein Q4B84_03375 [Clostridia bacterium]|nr:hypothetical protein [Clostridia bacterium]